MSGSGEHRNYDARPNTVQGINSVSNGFQEASSGFVHDITHDERAYQDSKARHERGYCLLDDALSARRTFTIGQLLVATLTVLGLAMLFVWSRDAGIVALSVTFASFYLTVVLFRTAVLAEFGPPKPPAIDARLKSCDKTYVILAALYHEAGQVRDLVDALDRLVWPEGKKHIHLICEEDDRETLDAVTSLMRRDIRLVIVPDGLPRTKPRALNYAMQHVRGDYLVLYDAEDRPHPLQLLEAATRFAGGGADLSCLQSPLLIDNRRENLITRFFAIEYDTLFLGILPALAKWKTPVPLGGTSNHFKLAKLREIGAWDSFNVTEDADLGIRLARFGQVCETLCYPTFEEAPPHLAGWMRQRTRWIKGWLQTLLVHLRNPLRTAKDMGGLKFFQFHMVLTSVVVSVLVHPFFLILFAFQMLRFFSGDHGGVYDLSITGLSAFNLVAGYLSYGLLAWAVQGIKLKNSDRMIVLGFPVYWLLISIAGWLAVFQLLLRPHHWAKTEHGKAKRHTPTF